jgi:hypothetical protein
MAAVVFQVLLDIQSEALAVKLGRRVDHKVDIS